MKRQALAAVKDQVSDFLEGDFMKAQQGDAEWLRMAPSNCGTASNARADADLEEVEDADGHRATVRVVSAAQQRCQPAMAGGIKLARAR